eukprot:TRINITY_DN8924_c0_g1_i3.p1 TRINITY_DN8924_c0_g1~~TRINITY_DN8924_c0_g1_i3.p1  ORF type:complete len:221 (+),score=105.77 TRINITY_DN8924_c0_g1_i3:173-835(+)
MCIRDSSCAADAECSWFNDGCKVRCSRLQTTNDCRADTECTLQESTGRCRMSCGLSGMNDCNGNDWCDWLSTSTCVDRCGLRFITDSSCNADAECMWDIVRQVCVRSCDTQYMVGDGSDYASRCTTNSMCTFNGTEPMVRQCEARCQYRHSSQVSCDVDPECIWDTFNTRCSADCKLQTTTSSCLANTMCCLLYTSDAADDLLCVDLGGRRIIKKKKNCK